MTQPMQIPDGLLTTDMLDELLDSGVLEEQLVGREVEHSNYGGTGTMVKTSSGRVLLEMQVPCHHCWQTKGKEAPLITVYLGSGLHAGAWCYCFSPDTGEYEANLRDQIVVCEECAAKRKDG
jgi:hypothetical protein